MPRKRLPPAQQQYLKKRTITDEEESKLQEAKLAFEARRYKSIMAAAKAYGVDYYTLRRRVKGLTVHCKDAHSQQQLLTTSEERVLVEWMQYLALTGHPLNKRTIRPKVQAILAAKGVRNIDNKHPSKTWIRRFTKRHSSELKTGRGSGLDPKRAQAFNFTTVHAHFKLVKETIEKHNIPWRNIYNMDEKGIQMGGGRKGTRTKYFFSAEDKMKYKLQSDDLQLVTVIEVVCADGTSEIGPGFVFPGTMKHREWFEQSDFKYTIGTSENGWTDDEIGFEWFKEVFIPQATERNCLAAEEERVQGEKTQPDREDMNQSPTAAEEEPELPPILLIYDGHGSHTTLDWITLARANNVILYCLPPHTTHRLQPLDVGVFGPLQTAWFNRCDEILDETGEGMDMRDLVQEYFAARSVSFKSENIAQAWRKSGLRPINADMFTQSDFAPSHSSSTICHAPPSFPSRMPHVSDASSDDGLFEPENIANSDDADYADTFNESSDSDSLGSSSSTGSDNDKDGEPENPQYPEPTRQNSSNTANTEDSDESGSDSESDGEGIQDTPLAKYPWPRPSTSSRGINRDLSSLQYSTPPDQPLTTSTSPRNYTRSKHQRDRVLLSNLSRAPSVMSSTPSSEVSNPIEARDTYIRKLQRELDYTRAQRDAAETHAVQAQRESAVWKHKFNKKKEKATKETTRRIHTSSRIVTNDQGLSDAQEDHRKRLEKKEVEAAKKSKQAAKQKEDLVRRATQGSTRIFQGSLGPTKNKTELEDIADALSIDISGTKVVLLERIKTCFDQHPRFKEDERFSGLFGRSRGRKRAVPDDENEPPISTPTPATASTRPTQRRRLSPSVNLDNVTNTYIPHSSNPFSSGPLSGFPVASSSQIGLEDSR